MKPAWLLPGLLAVSQAMADWQFEPAVDITGPRHAFHHIEAAGRQALAVSAGRIALAWEDDRDGTPHCRVAIRAADTTAFREYTFGQGECYAPGLATLADGRFTAIWEDEAGVNAALITEAGLGPIANLAPKGGQGALAWHPRHGLLAAWSQPDGRWRRLWLNALVVDGERLRPATPWPADPQPPKDDQMYPAVAAWTDHFAVAWEDRRLGHTVIYLSQGRAASDWSPPHRISHNQTGKAQGTDLGRGTGAMRPALASHGERLTVVWLDKRDFLSGYDVYATTADADGRFGRNAKVQDSFGDAIAQWHPATAGNARGNLVVAWDDDRDGTPDIWLASPTGEGYADNLAAAAGPHAQSDPTIAFDEAGNLHLAWVEKTPDGRAGIRYRMGKPLP